jgi:hypothetical protein
MRILIFLSLLVAGSSALALTQSDFSMGFGMESRAQRDVNPDYVNPLYSGQLFAKLRLKPWDLVLETSRSERDSGSGSLRVHSESTLLGAWGRYEFTPDREWTPYAALGMGNYFDKVSTSFQDSQADRGGNRKFLGLSAGVSAIFWEHLIVEGEGRILSLEQSKDPVFAALIRVGCRM